MPFAHFSDNTRPKCREQVLSGSVEPVDVENRERLLLVDRQVQQLAWKAGRSHVPSEPAQRA